MTSRPIHRGYAPSGNSWTNFAIEQESYANPLPADPAQSSVSWGKPAVVYVKHATEHDGWWLQTGAAEMVDGAWAQGGGGYYQYSHTNWMNFINQSNMTINVGWPADAGDAPSLPAGFLEYLNGALYATNDSASVATYWGWVGHSHGSGAYTDGGYASDPLSWTADTESVPEVYAGGMALRQVKVLLKITCPSLIWWLNGGLEDADYQENIPPQEVEWGSVGTPDENGVLYTAVAAGQRETIRPQANYPNYSSAIGVPSVDGYTLHIEMGNNDITDSNMAVVV
ncbi:MAG TPA: hypothetical protein VMV89_05930, partial [Candidatus Paceibacterota bacterium]|nr:hypothetical protein [Candidatus Paceibacterota bacterium]